MPQARTQTAAGNRIIAELSALNATVAAQGSRIEAIGAGAREARLVITSVQYGYRTKSAEIVSQTIH